MKRKQIDGGVFGMGFGFKGPSSMEESNSFLDEPNTVARKDMWGRVVCIDSSMSDKDGPAGSRRRVLKFNLQL